jgi:hypothetical protein
MRIPARTLTLLLLAASLEACGVPREAGRVAAVNATALEQLPADDQAVRGALVAQADAWTHLAALLLDRELGGIQGVDPEFTRLIVQTAALARRQRDLINQQEDDPPHNREALGKLRNLWHSADAYLNP